MRALAGALPEKPATAGSLQSATLTLSRLPTFQTGKFSLADSESNAY